MMIKKESILIKKEILISIILLIMFVFLAGCEPEKEEKVAAPIKPPSPVVKKEVVEEKKVEAKRPTYFYDPEGKRDPFKTFIKKPKIRKVEPTVPLTPLQEYEISQLKLTGIITGMADQNDNRAMVTDQAGKGYILKKGTLIGKNFGRVDRIEENAVIVIEDVQDFLGNIITKEIPLTLETEGGE